MAGLSLSMGAFGGLGSADVPAAANSPTGPSISQRAFGITSGQGGPRTAAYGTILGAAAGAALLVWLWWTLPR